MADEIDKNGDNRVPFESVVKDLDKGPRRPVGKLEEVSDRRSEELTPEQKLKESKQLEAYVIAHYWAEIEAGVNEAKSQLAAGCSVQAMVEAIYQNVARKVDPKLKSHIDRASGEEAHLHDNVAIRVMTRFAKVRDGEMAQDKAVVKTTEYILKGMIQGAASVLYFADGICKTFRARYADKISEDKMKEQLEHILKGKTFQKVAGCLGYSRGISMAAAFKGVLEDGPNGKYNLNYEGVDSGIKMQANYSENLFDEEKLDFRENNGEIELVVSPEVVGDIHEAHEGYKAGSKSADSLVWGCPSGFAKSDEGEVILTKFSELATDLYCETQFGKEKEVSELKLIQAKAEDVSDEDLRLLIENLIDSTHLPGSPYSKEDHVAGSIRTIKKAFEKGIVLAIKDGNKTVGIAAALSKKKMPEGDGRDMYELTKVSVLPEYRGRKLGSKLIEERLRMLREKFPDCPLSTATKTKNAIAVYRRLGWKEATWGDGSEVDLLIGGKKPDGSKDNGGPEWLKEWELMRDAEYKEFFFDPKERKSSGNEQIDGPEEIPDHFATTGENYAKYRPGYSEKVFDDLLKEVPGRAVAVDCGCGTGQIAGALSSRFEKVYGVDVSRSQLDHAVQAPNIQYLNQGAEDLKFLPDNSVDLITAGTAYPWFNPDKFWNEAKRVLKPGGTVAILQIRPPDIKEVPGLFDKFMQGMNSYIPKTKTDSRSISEQAPAGFHAISLPATTYDREFKMKVGDVAGWPKTTSAYNPYVKATGKDAADEFLGVFEQNGLKAEDEVTFINSASVLAFRKVA